jgi:hypothetical protein
MKYRFFCYISWSNIIKLSLAKNYMQHILKWREYFSVSIWTSLHARQHYVSYQTHARHAGSTRASRNWEQRQHCTARCRVQVCRLALACFLPLTVFHICQVADLRLFRLRSTSIDRIPRKDPPQLVAIIKIPLCFVLLPWGNFAGTLILTLAHSAAAWYFARKSNLHLHVPTSWRLARSIPSWSAGHSRVENCVRIQIFQRFTAKAKSKTKADSAEYSATI